MTARPGFWPFTADGIADPFEGYAAELAEHPARRLPDLGVAVVTGHRGVTTVLRDSHALVAAVPTAEQLGGGDRDAGAPLRDTLRRMLALSDGESRQRARRAMQRAFAVDVVGRHRFIARTLAEDLLVRCAPAHTGRPADLVEEYTAPIVATVLDDALALEPGQGDHIRALWKVASATVDAPQDGLSPDAPRQLAEIRETLLEAIDRCRPSPGPSATHAMLHGEGDRADGDELVANLIFVLTSGHRSLVQAMALAAHTLATQAHVMRRLGDGCSLDTAIEELLRWDGPVHLVQRVPCEDIALDTCTLRAGEPVMLFLGAANRDPSCFAEPDVVDLGTGRRQHVAFGFGQHYCVGATLARIVLRESVAALAAGAPGLRLTREPEWTVPRRGLRHLWVTW